MSELEAQIRRQHGVVTRWQLHRGGVKDGKIRTRLARGQLYRLHHGVYAVAQPALLPLSAASAALLATGPGSVLSHRSAAALWRIAAGDAGIPNVIVVKGERRHAGIAVHRLRRLEPADVTTHHNLRVTTPARSLIDFASDAPLSEVEHALSEGRALNLITDSKLEAALARVGRTHRGAAKVRALMNRQVGRVITRSERERKLLALLEAAGLPKPLVNHRLHGYVPDFYWPEHKLILEFDGRRTHGSRERFESDRKRDQMYATRGIQTLRATWLQLEHEPVALVVRVGQALAARAA